MYSKKTPTLIAVASGKGGVGKSTVAVNFAMALKQSGFQVGLLDTDLYGPSVRRMLPEDRMPSQRGETLVPALCKGIRMMSMAYFRKTDEAAVIRAPIANGVIKQFLNQVEWGPIDYLVIDFPPGTGDIQLTLSQQAPLAGALLVTTPQEVAVMDVRRSAHMFNQVKVPILGIVENMSYYLDPQTQKKMYLFGQGGGERLAGEIGVPLFEQIPIDPQLSERADRGISIFDEPVTTIAPLFMRLAEKVRTSISQGQSVQVKVLDPTTLYLEWTDGVKKQFNFAALQRLCPCAGCVEQKKEISDDVQAEQVYQVGRYALRIQFSSGCSNGIYQFDQLKAVL